MSPPYLRSDELKQTEMTLSLACIMKVAEPSATQGRISFAGTMRFSRFSLRRVFFPQRKQTTQTQETACEMTVASAAPFTPMSSA